MDDLKSQKTTIKESGAGRESAALRGLCQTMNAGFLAPGGSDAGTQNEIKQAMATVPATPMPTPEATQEVFPKGVPAVPEPEPDVPVVSEPPSEMVDAEVPEIPVSEIPKDAEPVVPRDPAKYRKIAFTGQMKVGKDFVAKAAGLQILSFAAPLYGLLEYFFGIGEENKDIAGGRAFMQTVGTWGRGDVDATHPVTPERAIFVQMIRAMAAAGSPLPYAEHVKWQEFGANKNLWLDALIARADGEGPYGIVNARFENELKRLDAEGWSRFHVMASLSTLQERWRADKVQPEALKHSSEQLAKVMDQQCKILAQRSRKPKVNVIWNDPKQPCPSRKFYTVDEFVKLVNG